MQALAPKLEADLPDSPAGSPPPAPVVVLFLDHTAAWSGGEIALWRTLGAMDRQQVRPLVLLAADGPLVEKLRDLGIETHVLPLGAHVREMRKDGLGLGALRRVRALFSTLAYAVQVARFARTRGVQVIHTNSLKSDIYGAIAGWLSYVPVVWHIRDHINEAYLPKPAVALLRFLAAHLPAAVIANSQSTLDELHLPATQRTQVAHDGLSLNPATPVSLVPRAWSDPVRIGLIGRITRWKGQHIFIEAARRVLAAGHRAEFWIVGSALFGEQAYEEEVRAQVTRAGLSNCILFQGFQSDIEEVYRQLDLLVHASITPEPFGQVVTEGMAEGLPVIGTDGGGVREIIRSGENGLLVPMGDAVAMAGAIESLLQDRARAAQLGAAGYQWVRRHFTAAQCARRIEHVYCSLPPATSSLL